MRPGLVLLLLVLTAGPALGQRRAVTEQRLQSLRVQIQGMQAQVTDARGDEASALRAVEGIETEIQLREELVAGYRTQLATTQRETDALRQSIERLEGEIEETKASYRARARHAYIHGRRNTLALILASSSINQMLVRARYLQQFARRRHRQVERIGQKTAEMRVRAQDVRQSLESTQRLLQQGQAEQQRLAARRRERTALVAEARTRRGRLEQELSQRQSDARQLEGIVRNLVAQERRAAEAERARIAAAETQRAEQARQAEIQRRADEAARRADEARGLRRQPTPRREARPQDAAPPSASPPATPPEPRRTRPEPRTTREPAASAAAPPSAAAPAPAGRPADRAVSLSGSFAQNRGRLPRPASGTVTGSFGDRKDPVYGTTISSIGIDIATAPGAPAQAVFEGVVERVGSMPTFGTYVMVSHGGEYTTIYGNLSAVVVQRGQTVRAGQAVGRAGTSADRRGSQLFFALFQGGRPVDPLGWLGR